MDTEHSELLEVIVSTMIKQQRTNLEQNSTDPIYSIGINNSFLWIQFLERELYHFLLVGRSRTCEP
jgi:hypothetical protein